VKPNNVVLAKVTFQAIAFLNVPKERRSLYCSSSMFNPAKFQKALFKNVVKLIYFIILFKFGNMKLVVSFIASTLLFSTTFVLYPIISVEKTIVQAQEANLNSAQAYLERGISYAKQGKHELAIADFNQALKINPNSADVYYNRGVSYYK
jgi:tetratricopeptide (TPR) repeat protein